MDRKGGQSLRFGAYLIQLLSVVIGSTAMVAFTVFLFTGPWQIVVLYTDLRAVLAFNVGLSALFFVQHSGMIRASFKAWFGRQLPAYYHGAVFSIISGICLYIVVHLWHASEITLLSAEGPLRLVLRGVFLAAVGSIIWSSLVLHAFDGFGVQAIRHHLHGNTLPAATFTDHGPYRWVRHPQYCCVLVMIWAHPELTVDRLLFNVLWSSWIVVGTMLEERDLAATFGEQYRDYQSRVPMLIPGLPRQGGG